jgi:hypothetical protein
VDIAIICPTRGRVENPRLTAESFAKTTSGRAHLFFVTDSDDPVGKQLDFNGPSIWRWELDPPPGNMGNAVNRFIEKSAVLDSYRVVGFIGDDHRFRSPGWEDILMQVHDEEGGGLFYGNDLARQDIPTQVFISSSIVRALGWMTLPGGRHLYFDNTWMTLGEEAGCMVYLPEVVIEHVHPFFGKAVSDEGYIRVNAPEVYDHDRKIYEAWLTNGKDADVARVRGALA